VLIQLTNANPLHDGDTILLNTDMILSVYRHRQASVVGDDGTVQVDPEKTIVFCPGQGAWDIKETPEEITGIINSSSK
jgi:hypothetical protein